MSPTPPLPSRENPLVCLLAYDGLCAFEYGIGLEVFGLPRPEFQRWYKLATVAVEPGPLRAIGGINVVAEADLDRLTQADIILVPGWRDAEATVPPDLIAALSAAYREGARIASYFRRIATAVSSSFSQLLSRMNAAGGLHLCWTRYARTPNSSGPCLEWPMWQD